MFARVRLPLLDAEPSELAEPAFLEQLASASLTFTLKEGEVKVQDVKMK